jgi:hypothetical protein
MKRALMLLAMVATLLGVTGCEHHRHMVRHGCGNPYCDHCGGCGNSTRAAQVPLGYGQQTDPAGPQTAQYAYPYYTIRGPRDFLLNEPSTIGN